MNLYLVKYNKKFVVIDTFKWIETNSLSDINSYIQENHNIEKTIYFPLISDMDNLRNRGREVLLFSDFYYYLYDINNSSNDSILRGVIIKEILE